MTSCPPPVPDEVCLKLYRKALDCYGDIDVEVSSYTQRLRSVVQYHLLNTDNLDASLKLLERWHTNDLYLSVGCAHRTEAAWRKFDSCFKPFIQRVACQVCGNSNAARELTFDVFADLFMSDRSGKSRIASYDGQCALTTWLRAVVANKAINEHKCRWKNSESLDSVESMIDTEQPARLEAALRASKYGPAITDALQSASQRLSQKESLLLLLRYQEGLHACEIARREGVHPSTVTRQLQHTQDKFLHETISILTHKHRLSELAIQECLAEVVENPSYSIVSCLNQAGSRSKRLSAVERISAGR